jgi:catechol 2,3-dioxygenase-like lactoylglutathione lyase family enzyme
MAFYWFPDAPPSQPGIAQSDFFTSVKEGGRDITTASGSMNHFAFDVAPDKIEAYREVLINEGLQVTDVWNHSDRPGVDQYMPARPNEDTFIRSIYFPDPDGIVLEFACWGRPLTEDDVIHEGKRESDLARNRT